MPARVSSGKCHCHMKRPGPHLVLKCPKKDNVEANTSFSMLNASLDLECNDFHTLK